MTVRPFRPTPSGTLNVAVAASSTSPLKLTGDQDGPTTIRVMNDGSATAWIEFGGSAVTASLTTSFPVPTKGVEKFTVQAMSAGGVWVATIAAGATGNVYFSLGTGL